MKLSLFYAFLPTVWDRYKEKGIPEENICCVCMISSPQGIENVFKEFPDITLIVAAVDSHLNERGYIVPGMGISILRVISRFVPRSLLVKLVYFQQKKKKGV